MAQVTAEFDHWHADEMRRIENRARVMRAVVLGMGGLLLTAGVVAWFF